MLRFFLAATVLWLAIAKVGVTQNSGQAGTAREKASSRARAAQPAPHSQITRLLRALEGTWSITEDLAPDTRSPKGRTGTGKVVWRPGPGGFTVVEDYHSKEGEDEVSGLGMLWWDDAGNGYHTIWCDSTNPGGCIDFKTLAHWEMSKLVLQDEYEVDGKKFTFREEFGDITDDRFTQTLYGGPVGGPLKVDMTIHATRIRNSAK